MSGASKRVAVLHGINLDTLGLRDPDIYGTFSLADLEERVVEWGGELGIEVSCFQTNHEGSFCEHLHSLAPDSMGADGVVVNAGAWTHYSWAIRDALEVAGLPAVEVHISDVEAREDWRRVSVFEGLVVEKISGEGLDGYRRALEILSRTAAGR